MKNELGIEVKCENCVYLSAFCKQSEKDCYVFSVKPSALKQRIIELQEQQFTEEELQFIKNRLDECIEEWDVPDMVFMAHQILQKIEMILNNE